MAAGVPHGITGVALATAAFFVWLIELFPVLIKHRRWRLRVSAYARLLTDDYPPFALD